MTAVPPQMDAVSSFQYLVDNVPLWQDQLGDLTSHTSDKHADFVAEYARLVKAVKPKRLKSPSITSIRSDKSRSTHLPDVDPEEEAAIATPDTQAVDPLVAGNRYLYADQTAQRKRKSNASLRSGASGPQRFRTKNQVVIHYDGHVQEQLDAMFKNANIARNNLRKGRNALNASRGFRLPTLSKTQDNLTSSSLENIRSMSKRGSSPLTPGAAKITLSRRPLQAQDKDEEAFLECDKALEQVSVLYETAAHQFLRDGDCKKELDNAQTKLVHLVQSAKATVESLQEKARLEAAEDADQPNGFENSRSASVLDRDCPSLLTDKSSLEPLRGAVADKTVDMPTISALKSLRPGGIVDAGMAPDAKIASANMLIEVDDGSGGSLDEIDIDLSQFRSANRLRMRA